MSQDYFSSKGKARDDDILDDDILDDDILDDDILDDDILDEPTAHDSTPAPSSMQSPRYITVGNGSAPEYAAQLQALLDGNDSGYGGSSNDNNHAASLARDYATQPDIHNHSQASAIHQLWYEQHRSNLGRSISRVVELLKELQEMNTRWPAHYPSVLRIGSAPELPSRPGMQHTYSVPSSMSSNKQPTNIPPPPLRRLFTTAGDAHEAESSHAQANIVAAEEPRLVTPQIAQDFSILKLDLKLGSLHQVELVHSLEKGSIASLLDGQISLSIRHLLSLRDRIADTSSKVLVTGDLNAGKSTFCNALLRRKILPVDQQPCTSIFCEVLDAKENSGIEEVHAVHKDAVYNRHDESTYDVFMLHELEKIVVDNATYTLCKVYVTDARTIDESLLNNGVLDIALIDAPGLNSDTTKTTAVFARQEEIDVVVFVVSAANHFTLTATEFISAAAKEKAYLFMVVNGFDNIRDKARCKKMILRQVSGLSPQTYKESDELVHFVSSNAVPMALSPPGGPNSSGNGSSSGGGGGGDEESPDDNKGKGKGKDLDKMRDFETLEQSLRRFVLEKRARSKLAPAKTYLLNILNDINTLATVNVDVAQGELDRVTMELREIEPQLETTKLASGEVSEITDRTIEETSKNVYDQTRAMLTSVIAHAGDNDHGVEYRGIFSAFEFADELKNAMMMRIAQAVTNCEQNAKDRTVGGVNTIKQLGLLHVGDEFQNLTFRPEAMFKRKRDSMARQVEIPTELWDFIDWSTLFQQETMAGTGMALTLAGTMVPRIVGVNGWMDHAVSATRLAGHGNLRRLIIPGILFAAAAATAYIINQIPKSLPSRLSARIATELVAMDYVHDNAMRISSTVRKVLRVPAHNLQASLEQNVRELGARREETLKVRKQSEVALKYFSNLVRNSGQQLGQVNAVDLDAPPLGAL